MKFQVLKISILSIIAALTILVSTAQASPSIIETGIVEIIATCGSLVPGVRGVACVCNGMVGNLGQIAHGDIFCSPEGWTQNYPITLFVESCPRRVNRFRPPADGCGSTITGTNRWLPQKYAGVVDFGKYVCGPHDLAYSDCGTSKEDADEAWKFNTRSVCLNYFGSSSPTALADCIQMGAVMISAVEIAGYSSWEAAQREACQCGPNVECMGAQPRFCINCPTDGLPFDGITVSPEDGTDPLDVPCPGGC